MDSQCDSYRNPSVLNVTFATALAVLIGLSYAPQHVKIIQRRTIEGIAPLFILLGTLSGMSAFANLLLITRFSARCCKYGGISGFECYSGQLSLIQVGVQALFAAGILWVCVYFTKGSPYQDKAEYAKIKKVYNFVLLYSGALVVLILYCHKCASDSQLIGVANVLGLLSTGFASFQYFPQIYEIYKLKHPGSLSIAMMCMQTPGGFVWSLSLILSPGSIWSSWLPYLTSAMLQAVLLCMCVYYERSNIIKTIEHEVEAENTIETEPLL